MKNNVSKIIVSLAILAATASLAGAEDQNKNEAVELPSFSVQGIDTMPTLVKRSIPLVSTKLVGSEVTLKFTIDAKGRPTGVDTAEPLHSIDYPRDRDFAVQMIQAVKHWRFEPARGADGEAKALKVLMPVKVTQRENKAIVQASFRPLSGK